MIKINNKEYNFKFGFRAMLKFEESTGQSISSLGDNFKMSTLVELAYAGFTEGELTKDDIIDAIDEDMGLIEVLTTAFQKDMAAMNLVSEEAKK